MTREQADRDLFDRIARRYARKDIVASSSLARKSQLLAAIKPVLDQLSNLGTIVDVGCGVGAPARYLAGHYERYIGIDQSKEMINAAITFNRGNPKAEFIAENVKSRDLPQNVADVILSDGVLHHITELDEALNALLRIAKPDAFLVVREPQNGNPLLQALRWGRGIVDPSYSGEQIFFSERDLRELFSNHGVMDISVEFQGFLSTPFAQVVIPPQLLSVPLCRAAISIDRWLDARLPGSLKKLSFNIIVIGRFNK
ncbi:MAG: methyltransferase domain-containing protein [Chloroflexi bacterium]|nr:methyltransferase domain-containing protein [Chloroflexota bacterium]